MTEATPINVTVTSDATDDRVILMPPGDSVQQAMKRVCVWASTDPTKRSVLRAGQRPNEPAGVTATTFAALGGRGQGQLGCHYREGTSWDILRASRSARRKTMISILTLAIAVPAAWLTFDKAIGSDSGARWWASVVVFVLGVPLGWLKFRKDLDDAMTIG